MFLHSPFMLVLLGILLDPTVGGMLHFSSSPEYVGLSVMTNNGTDDVLFDERLADLGECAKECTAFSCLSFTYNWISGNCQGYSEIYSTIEPFREDHGSQYYQSNCEFYFDVYTPYELRNEYLFNQCKTSWVK
uniref:Uncharacterized protein n=1 Tax=Magallana gigas TaxID=29159 RepID=K1RFB4_MAGGI